jgi:hypothetical protein
MFLIKRLTINLIIKYELYVIKSIPLDLYSKDVLNGILFVTCNSYLLIIVELFPYSCNFTEKVAPIITHLYVIARKK